MRIGISTPVVMQMPGVASDWERTAGPDELARVAAAADDLGFEFLTCAEHVVVPEADAAVRGATYWDPVATLGFLAAHTTRIRLATSVIVLGYHHPLEVAKRYGTVDRLSGGRVILGVGVGSLKAEFDLLDAAWSDRGARADEAIRALRASLSQSRPHHDGEHYRYSGFIVEPCAVQDRVPIWVGGRTRRSLRRAVTLGDGWMPFGISAAQISEWLGSVELPDGFEVVLATSALDPLGDPDAARRRLDRLRELGATAVTATVSATSAAHYCEQLAALRDLAMGDAL
ncbi:LLM class F420-dependent oxidoreductase [Mycolicibacterium thermoresistibile]|jgi:probable F420-dependent oxidoreductase